MNALAEQTRKLFYEGIESIVISAPVVKEIKEGILSLREVNDMTSLVEKGNSVENVILCTHWLSDSARSSFCEILKNSLVIESCRIIEDEMQEDLNNHSIH